MRTAKPRIRMGKVKSVLRSAVKRIRLPSVSKWCESLTYSCGYWWLESAEAGYPSVSLGQA